MSNSKNKKILLIVVIAVIVGALAFVAAYIYLKPQRTTLYVFNDNYKAGATLKRSMLNAVSADSTIVVTGRSESATNQFITSDQLDGVIKKGESLRMDVSNKMPLMSSMLSSEGGSSIERVMDEDKIAVTVPVSNTTGVSADLKDGSRVNIYTQDGETAASVLILQNMRILAVTKDDNGDLSAATIECTQDQALQLTYYSTQSSVYFGLVNGSSYQDIKGTPSFKPGA